MRETKIRATFSSKKLKGTDNLECFNVGCQDNIKIDLREMRLMGVDCSQVRDHVGTHVSRVTNHLLKYEGLFLYGVGRRHGIL